MQERNIKGNTIKYFFIFSFSAAFFGFSFALRSSIHFIGSSIYGLLNIYPFNVLDVDCLPGLSSAHFIASIAEHEEGYENKYRQQDGYYHQPFLMRHFITLSFQKGGEACLGRVPYLIIYGTPYV